MKKIIYGLVMIAGTSAFFSPVNALEDEHEDSCSQRLGNAIYEHKSLEDQLFFAVYYCDLDKIKQLLDTGANINDTDKNGDSLLCRALRNYYDGSGYRYTTGLYSDPSAEDEILRKRFEAVDNKKNIQSAIVDYLIDKVDPNIWSKVNDEWVRYDSPLSICIQNFSHNFNRFGGKQPQNPIENSVKWANILLDRGANPNNKSPAGETALHHYGRDASSHTFHFNQEFIQKLLDKGADINAKDNNGNTPLYSFVRYFRYSGNIETIEFLISKGADVNAVSNDGKTLLHHAYTDIMIKFLLEKTEIKIDAQKIAPWDGGETPMHICAGQGKVDLIKTLIARGFDVNVRNECGNTPLVYAVRQQYYDTVEFLVKEAKADVNTISKRKATPFSEALECIGCYSKPDYEDERRRMVAVKIAKFLADNGAK